MLWLLLLILSIEMIIMVINKHHHTYRLNSVAMMKMVRFLKTKCWLSMIILIIHFIKEVLMKIFVSIIS